MRVLVVEDEIRLAENIAAGLRDGCGYAVDVAHDGEDGMLLCRTANFDLIVLDLMIPRLSGEEVVRQVRAARVGTPVLILTAVATREKTIELLNAGADDYMTKPFDLGELLARSRALIRRGKGVERAIVAGGTTLCAHRGTDGFAWQPHDRVVAHGVPNFGVPDVSTKGDCVEA